MEPSVLITFSPHDDVLHEGWFKTKIGQNIQYFGVLANQLRELGWDVHCLDVLYYYSNADRLAKLDFSSLDDYIAKVQPLQIFHNTEAVLHYLHTAFGFERHLNFSQLVIERDKAYTKHREAKLKLQSCQQNGSFSEIQDLEHELRKYADRFLWTQSKIEAYKEAYMVESEFEWHLLENFPELVQGVNIMDGSVTNLGRKDHASLFAMAKGIPIPETFPLSFLLSSDHDVTRYYAKQVDKESSKPKRIRSKKELREKPDIDRFIAQEAVIQPEFGAIKEYWLNLLNFGTYCAVGEVFYSIDGIKRLFHVPLTGPDCPKGWEKLHPEKLSDVFRIDGASDKYHGEVKDMLSYIGIENFMVPESAAAMAAALGAEHRTSCTTNYVPGHVPSDQSQRQIPYFIGDANVLTHSHNIIARRWGGGSITDAPDLVVALSDWGRISGLLLNREYLHQHNNT